MKPNTYLACLGLDRRRWNATAIALETSKGDLPLALGLGGLVLAIVLALNAAAFVVR